jgi:predicted transposase/invertase (TIGR01784 family)
VGNIAHPHDRFMKLLLSEPERAGTLLRERLPKALSEQLAPEPPEHVEGSFVDETMQDYLTDRLFQAKTITGRTALLYILFEHKSFLFRRIGWQFLKYMVEALKQWERKHPKWKHLPAIVPFLFYHGKKTWKIPNEFLALVDAEDAWRPYLLNFPFTIMDLGQIDDPVLSQQPQLRAWLLAMKYATRADQQIAVQKLLTEALASVSLEELYIIMHYLLETYSAYNEQILRAIIRRVQPQEEDAMMSQFAQDIISKGKPKWLQQGRQEGRQEGLKRGLQQGLLRGSARTLLLQLQERFGTSLPDWVTAKLYSADEQTLITWTIRILKANTLDEVFQEML